MKHLKDMSIEIKSHMKYLDDDVAEKVRQKFKQEVEHIKKLESERRLIQQQLRDKDKDKAPKATTTQSAENPFGETETPTQKDTLPVVEEELINPFLEKKADPKQDVQQKQHHQHNRQNQQSQQHHTGQQSQQRRSPDQSGQRHDRDRNQNDRGRDKQNQNRTDRQNLVQEKQVWSEKPHRPAGDRQQNQQHSQNRDRNQQNRTDYQNRNDRNQNQQYRQGSGNRQQQSPFGDNRQQNRKPTGERADRPERTDRQNYTRTDRPNTDRSPRPTGQRPTTGQTNRPGTTGVSFPKAGIVKPEGSTAFDDKLFGKKKTSTDDLGDKSKHIQAKIQNTKRRKKIVEVVEVDELALEKNIKQTLAGGKKKKKYKKEEKRSSFLDELNEITISEFTSVSELAKILDVPPTEIIQKFWQMGKMVSINLRLDRESLELICSEYHLNVIFSDEYGTELLQDKIDDLADIDERSRPPVVTIMGHVDHGKTSILDCIRNTKVVADESGGITQHIGAYQAMHKGQKVTFIDTPGHEAFTAMRARGANITDLAVIVVAANDGVKPQTIEAIDHARAAGVTMVIAINKIDLPEANIDRTISSLLEQNIYLEGYGGQIPWARTSALKGTGIDDLLEVILLSAEMKELKARFNGPGKGIVIESEKNAQMGTKATILLQEGTLKKGDNIVVGSSFGHVRKMENERTIEQAQIYPSDIAVVYGLNKVPKSGDILNVVESEKIARQIGGERQIIRAEREKYQGTTNLGNLYTKIKQNEMTELKLIIKGDVDGSVEAVCDSLQKLSTEEIAISIIKKGVGGIIEADVNLASASEAIIVGFNVRANNKAKKLADDTGVEIKFYQIIYDAIDEIRKAMIGMLLPDYKEKILGQALVKQLFKMKKIGTIAGCSVEKGVIQSKTKVRLFRDDKVIFDGELQNLRHHNDDVKEAQAGTECGITIKNFNDIKEGDVIECYIIEAIPRQKL
jgi:translation initiation factor IF-2